MTYHRERYLANIVPNRIIDALASTDLAVRRTAILELQELADREADRLRFGAWTAAAPITEAELRRALRCEREMYVRDAIWSHRAA